MTLQLHPIALGCMLVVAVGTLIYTYISTRQQTPDYGYRGSNSRYNDDYFEPFSRTSSISEESEQSRRRKKDVDHCSICLGAFKQPLRTLLCNHVFHDHCISTWLISNNTCPICRSAARI